MKGKIYRCPFSAGAHNLKAIPDDKRDIVNRGDVISLAGNTGISSGPHLHFEVWEGSNPLDPLNFFPEYNEKNLSVE